jgi:hypothetical protein
MSDIVHTSSSAASFIRIASVLGDAGIVWALSFIGGAAIGIVEHGKSLQDMMPALALSNSLLLTMGFMISGARNPTERWLPLLFGLRVQQYTSPMLPATRAPRSHLSSIWIAGESKP